MNIRRHLAIALGLALIWIPISVPQAAGSLLGGLLQGTLSTVMVRKQLSDLDEHGQEEVLQSTIKSVGYLEDESYQQRARNILQKLTQSGVPKRNYTIFVNPDTNINAFCTLAGVLSVNKGTIDALDEDQLAFVIAHEMGHAEHRDIVNGATKKMTLGALGGAVVGGDSGLGTAILVQLGTNFVNNEVFTMKQERGADELGFHILAASPYNIGGAPAAMATLLDESGDHFRDGITRIVAPNSHPRTASRIEEGVKRVYEYSGKKVTVKDGTVIVHNQPVLTPIAAGNLKSEIRAYYVAGKLARLFHQNQVTPATLNGNVLTMGKTSLYTFGSNEDRESVLTRLNNALTNPKSAPKSTLNDPKSNPAPDMKNDPKKNTESKAKKEISKR